MKKKTAYILILPLILCSCSKKEAAYSTEIINGIKVIHNSRLHSDTEYKDIGIAVDLVVGVEEGKDEYMLYSPVDIDTDQQGNIYILDMKDALIKKYDPDGLFISTIGRKGKGPGEFDRPNQIEIDSSNRIIVADPYQRRYTFLSSKGDLIKSVRMGPYVTSLVCGKEGLILAGYGWVDTDGMQEHRISRLDSETGKINDMFVQKQYWPARLMNDQLRYDFPYFVRAAIDSQNRIIVGVGTDYEFRVLDSDGELEFKFTKVYDKISVRGEMLGQIANITLKGPNPYVKNPYFPVFESLSIDEEDNIWIQHHVPKWIGKINTETFYDVFSPEGFFLFTTKIPGHIDGSLKFKNGFVYALKLRESGFIQAVRYSYLKESTGLARAALKDW
jgi:hypothetical protein